MKKTKRMLLHSAIAMLLCISMLAGSTYAWFSKYVTSGRNIITSGNLDLEMYWTDDLDSGVWHNVEDDEYNTIFNYDNWEPGYTDVKYIKLVNVGELAFNYKLSIDPQGSVGKLAEVINVYYANDKDGIAVESREDLDKLTSIGLLNEVMSGGATANGVLLADGEISPIHDSGDTIITIAMTMITTAGNEYMGKDAGDFTITAIATQAPYEKDSFGDDYDSGLEFPTVLRPGKATVDVTPVDGKVPAGGVALVDGNIAAVVPEGTLLADGTDKLTLTVTPLEKTTSDITVVNNEVLIPVDVHIDGIADNNTTPIVIDLGVVLPKYLNMGNYHLYHVEDGVNQEMTLVSDKSALVAHNQFTYDPNTGAVSVSMASFSEVVGVVDKVNAWVGEYDYEFGGTGTATDPYIISTADELAGLAQIVGGMDGQTQDSYTDKYIKLISDINLGYGVTDHTYHMFTPIGYYYDADHTFDDGTEGVYSTVNSFEGTFDGNGHTISNFYQNTWEINGDYDAGYYNDGMGLFGYVLNGTVKNLTVNNFSSDGEFAPTGVIAAYAVNSTFENIAITYCNPRVYNTGNGGIVGIGGNSDDPDTYKLTFNNITIDNTNKITALWGSWDVACGGLVGMFRGAGHAYMTNCHVAAQIDVYNDVCGNYQYYWYRYSGMMIGTNKNMITDADGYTVPETSKFHATNCTVHFGDWNDYYYCELVANTLASYTHDHQFSRLEQIQNVSEIQDGNGNWNKAGNFILMNGKTPTETCYHIVNKDGVLKEHKHADAGEETVNGEIVLKENNQRIYLPFNQLFTGYGWGVKHIPVYNGDSYAFEGITILDRDVADSVEKFKSKDDIDLSKFESGTSVAIDDLFEAVSAEVGIKNDTVMVSVTDLTKTGITAEFTRGETWGEGELKFNFNGTGGYVQITIQDYYFCKPTSITVKVGEFETTDRFEVKFPNTDKYLYRVGNQNAVSLGSLFGEVEEGIGAVSVNVESTNVTVTNTPNDTWTKGTLKFEGTGIVNITISDDNFSTPITLPVEVVDAKNITKAESATSNNVVLLNDISGTFTVSNGYTFYGNGFTVTLPTTSVQNVGNGFTGYISVGASQDDGIANGGHLDNVRIKGPVYPEMYIYRDQAKITDTSDADYGDGYNMRYFKNSVIVYGGNVTISNCYISGSRTALCLRGGNSVVIENTMLSGGAYANMQICAGSNVTLRNLTTEQVDETDSYGKDKKAHGLGIAVDSSVVDIYIEGELNQYNWLCEEQWNEIVPSTYQSVFPKFFSDSTFNKYWHYLNGGTDPYVNLTFIYACNWDTSKIHDNRTTVDYGTCNATIAGVSGGVYSKINTVGGNTITDDSFADPGYTSPGFNPIAPVLKFDNTVNNDVDDANDANDTYCVYDETNGTLKIGVSGDSKTIDLSGVAVVKNGNVLAHTAFINGTQISGNSVTIKAADGAKQTLTFKATSNDAGYDKDGNPIAGSVEYTWSVTVEIAVLAYPAPVWNMGGDYQFDTSNCVYAYYSTSQGYGEAVPIYEGIKINYYDKSGTLVNLDLSGTTTLPTGSNNSNSNAFTYTLDDGSTLTMKYSSGWKSGATTHQFTSYGNKVYVYPQSLDNDNYVRAKTTNQDFDVKITYTFTDPNGQSTGTQTMQWYNAKATNGSVDSVQWKDFDSTNGKKPSTCVTPDTLVTLADGTQKRIDEVTYSDKLLVWNFYEGKYDVAPVAIIFDHGADNNTVIKISFNDGTEVKVVNMHQFFNADLNKLVTINADTVDCYVGHKFAKRDGNETIFVELESYSITNEYVEAWGVMSGCHYNIITEDMISADFDLKDVDLFNYFEIDEGMKFDEAKMKADIEKYGLYTYDDFAEYLTYEQFVAFNVQYFKIPVSKGLYTYDGILELIDQYLN